MPRLNKRDTAPPKPLPQRGKEEEETETTLCTFEDTPKEKHNPYLGWCKSCSKHAAHSAVDQLCLNCHMEAAGYTFDEEINRWVKAPERKRK